MRYSDSKSHKKKILNHPQADENKRAHFLEQLQTYEQNNSPIIYLDESGFKSHDYRPLAYAPKGQRCYGTHNWQLKNITNAIGAIHNGQLFSVGLYDCSINSNIFHHWVKTLLLPQLPQGSVIVMDNATFHKRQDIQELIKDAGHAILWLPPYSPDFNPIEKNLGVDQAETEGLALRLYRFVILLFHVDLYQFLISFTIVININTGAAFAGVAIRPLRRVSESLSSR